MKTYSFAIIATLISIFFVSGCKKDGAKKDEGYKCTTCAATPEAIAANNASSKGIYKGLVIGSTGTIKFNIQNGGTTITATLVIDGTTVELTSSVAWESGQPYVAPFTGTLNGQAVSIGFSVSANGSSPSVTSSDIPGHPDAEFAIEKESSNALIECFEGTYTTSDSEAGTFNILLSRTLGLWEGINRENGEPEADSMDGTINGNKITVNTATGGIEIGTLSNDEVSGKFKDDEGVTISFKGKRTL